MSACKDVINRSRYNVSAPHLRGVPRQSSVLKRHTALLGVFIRLEAIAASERSAESHKRRFRDAPPNKMRGRQRDEFFSPLASRCARRKAAVGILAFIERCPQRRLITGQNQRA